MTTLNPQTTIGELVKNRPARSRIFEQLGIDYCCGGKLPLAEACAKRGVEVSDVLDRLTKQDTQGETDPNALIDADAMGLSELADHIEQTHHAYLKTEIPRLEGGLRKVAAVHGGHHPWMREVASIFDIFAAELTSHMRKEEQGLFPRIRSLEHNQAPSACACGVSLEQAIGSLEHEHESSGEALARMSQLSNGYKPPEDACNTFRAMLDGLAHLERDMHQHVHKENNVLFPKAIALEQQASDSSQNDPGAGATCSVHNP